MGGGGGRGRGEGEGGGRSGDRRGVHIEKGAENRQRERYHERSEHGTAISLPSPPLTPPTLPQGLPLPHK